MSEEIMALPAPMEPATLPEIPPEAREALEKLAEALRAVAESLRQVIQQLADALRPVIEYAAKVMTRLWEAIARGLVPKKWWHLYKHAKKRRTRKKYEKKIREAVLAALAEGTA